MPLIKINIFIETEAGANRYIERKRAILPVSYRLSRKIARRNNGAAKAKKIEKIIVKLEKKENLQSRAINFLQKDLKQNDVIINISDSE